MGVAAQRTYVVTTFVQVVGLLHHFYKQNFLLLVKRFKGNRSG